jgi:hypothetical protein
MRRNLWIVVLVIAICAILEPSIGATDNKAEFHPMTNPEGVKELVQLEAGR